MSMCCVFTSLFASFRLCSFSLVPVSLRSWGFVHLRGFIFFMDSFSSLWDLRQDDRYPRSHYYHCYASCFVLSLCCATYLLFIKPPKLPCQPLTFSPFLTNHCLAMFLLCSAPLIVLLVAGEVEDCPMMEHYLLVGISLYCHVIFMHLYTW